MKALRRLLWFIVIACPWGLPSAANAHASDILLMRLSFGDASEATIEVTADLEGVPWLRDASNPAEAIGKAIRLHLPDGRSWFVQELGQPKVTIHARYPHPSPVPLQHQPQEPSPELYTAAWTWRPSTTPLRFEILKGSHATAIFWKAPPDASAIGSEWQMLAEGDVSNAAPLPFPPKPLSWNWKATTAAGIAAAGLCIQACLIVSRLRRMRRGPAF